MNIGFLLPSVFAVDTAGNGIRVQAWRQAEALERLGHTVIRMNPWLVADYASIDVAQFFLGGFGLQPIELMRDTIRTLAFAPIIDSNYPNWAYRLTAEFGARMPRFRTNNGEFLRQARGSDLIIARSTHERDRVVRGLGVDTAKTHIVLNGVNPPRTSDPEIACRTLDLPDDYILHVSTYTQERKNAVRLAEAAILTGYPIVFAGTAKEGPVRDRLRELAGAHPQIRLMGFLEQEVLDSLYAGARVFALPSSHEGTGLAALEAGAHGANIVITRNGGAPDYFLNMAEYVEPTDRQSIRDALGRAWTKPRSTALQQHIVQNLTWEASAASLVRTYEPFVARARPRI